MDMLEVDGIVVTPAWVREAISRINELSSALQELKHALRMAADEPNIDKARAIADAVLMTSQ